ncbi:MAG: hypothetical protein IJG36_01015 [Synergistaceae bacterium]|nr:hypothetical protein [Synergistaceae bacterium]MBR0248656.1 hypothetical protein [Synergistaceae bacterium]
MAVRNADDILIGGARIFITENNEQYELGYMSGEFKIEEQASEVVVKESEGSTVTIVGTDKEVHLTFNLLECNLDTLAKLNPSATTIGGAGDTESDGKGFAVGTFQSDKTFPIEMWHKKRSGKYRCARFFKAKVSGNFTSFILNQDNESPIAVDIVAIGDDSKNTTRNIYEVFECEASKAPGGGW